MSIQVISEEKEDKSLGKKKNNKKNKILKKNLWRSASTPEICLDRQVLSIHVGFGFYLFYLIFFFFGFMNRGISWGTRPGFTFHCPGCFHGCHLSALVDQPFCLQKCSYNDRNTLVLVAIINTNGFWYSIVK